ncbi:hypothetical protein AHAS_Ahas18G0092600 [Arachis hypogaea]
MMTDLEERIVNLEKRKSINCCVKGLKQLSSNASNSNDFGIEEVVSGFLYDKFQKEVVNLRKSCEVEDSNLQAKDEEIKMLAMKGDGLIEAMEVELKKMKIEAAAREKEVSSSKTDEKKKTRITSTSKRFNNLTLTFMFVLFIEDYSMTLLLNWCRMTKDH